ncbi:MAG: translation elongation factor Ts [Tenericutes bacterium]|nr:MAG: translation elongation factor Ts [Mycoplasmatota bacterium]
MAKAAKKAGRIAAEGIVKAKTSNGRTVIFELNSETDYVSSNADFLAASEKIADVALASNATTLEEVLELDIDGETVENFQLSLTSKIGEKISIRRLMVVEGNASFYEHTNKRIATVIAADDVELDVLKDIAMHAAAMSPRFGTRAQISDEFIKNETSLLTEQYKERMPDKTEEMLSNIVKGALNKQLSELVLVDQAFVKDPSKKISDLLGGKELKTYIRFETGEGIDKKQNDFAAEVAAQIKDSE